MLLYHIYIAYMDPKVCNYNFGFARLDLVSIVPASWLQGGLYIQPDPGVASRTYFRIEPGDLLVQSLDRCQLHVRMSRSVYNLFKSVYIYVSHM